MIKKLPRSKILKEQLKDEVRVKIFGENENKVMLENKVYT